MKPRTVQFGDPSDSLVPEAVWFLHREGGLWPLWRDVIADLTEHLGISDAEAEARLLGAIRDGEVVPRLDDVFEPVCWAIRVDEATTERLTRRLIDKKMPRRDKEENY